MLALVKLFSFYRYGVPDDDQLLITDMDRFLIPNASVATGTISKYIVKQLDA